jgi:hypothetical protein
MLGDYRNAASRVGRDADAIRARLDQNASIEEVVYELYKKRGTDDLIKLKASLKNINDFTGLKPDLILTRPEKHKDALRLFEELGANPLVKRR